MSKILYAEGTGGKIVILNGSANLQDTLTSPISYLNNVHFHSDLNYLKLANYFDVNITFPERAANTQSSTQKGKTYTWYVPTNDVALHTMGYHNLGYKPVCLLYQNTDGIGGNFPVQQNVLSLRLVSLRIETDYVYLAENWGTYQYTLPQTTQNFKVLVFKDP